MEADGGTTTPRGTGLRQALRTINVGIIVRFCKYVVLLCGVSLTLMVVFHAYSFYVARRELDSELRSKKVSSLEYLNVLTQRERALAITTLEARCLQRLELALFRIFDAAEYDKIDKVYDRLFEQKARMQNRIETLGHDLIDVAKAVEHIKHPYFQLSKLEVDYINKPLNDEAAKNARYTELRKAFKIEKDQYIAIAVDNVPLRERLAHANDSFQKVYRELVEQKARMRSTITTWGPRVIKVDKAVAYLDSPEFVLAKLEDHFELLDKQTDTSEDYQQLIEEIKKEKGRYVEIAATNVPLREEAERLVPLQG